jgi:TetR/AcrR family transcriptional repressor of bet genes
MTVATLDPGRKNRTAIRETRRRQLIEATIDSIAELGFTDTTLASVTKRAELSHGTINFHFKSKEALFAETLGFLAREHYDHWHSAMKKAGSDPCKQLAAIIEVDFRHSICSPKKLAVWFAFWGQVKYRPAYSEVHNKYDEQRLIELERLLGEIVEDGGYDHVAPTTAARHIEALVDGLWLNLLLYPKAKGRLEARNDTFSYLANLFPRHCIQSQINSGERNRLASPAAVAE